MSRATVESIQRKIQNNINFAELNLETLKTERDIYRILAGEINQTLETAIALMRKQIDQDEQANLLVTNLENLEVLLSQESDLGLLKNKTLSLKTMLNAVVINPGTPEELDQNMEKFLFDMSAITAEKNLKTAIYSMIAATLLVMVIMTMLSYVVFPLIPVEAGMKACGLTDFALKTAEFFCNTLIYLLSMFIIGVPVIFVQRALSEPLGRFMQRNTDEYKAAETLCNNMFRLFSNGRVIKIEDNSEEQALISVLDGNEMLLSK